jgi:hypothetical protein
MAGAPLLQQHDHWPDHSSYSPNSMVNKQEPGVPLYEAAGTQLPLLQVVAARGLHVSCLVCRWAGWQSESMALPHVLPTAGMDPSRNC